MKEYLTYKATPIPQPVQAWDDEEIRSMPICESGERLFPLGMNLDKIIVSPQYYTQNIEGALAESYARQTVRKKLIHAAGCLPFGYRFVIFDCWRPLKVQQALFDNLKKGIIAANPSMSEDDVMKRARKYVAFPSRDEMKPTPHNTGGAVDLTIADENGLVLNMGTEFDDSSEKAETVYFERLLASGDKLTWADREALNNRRILYHIMKSAGFTNYTNEWWHFDYGNQNWAWCSGSAHAIYGKTHL